MLPQSHVLWSQVGDFDLLVKGLHGVWPLLPKQDVRRTAWEHFHFPALPEAGVAAEPHGVQQGGGMVH